MIKLSEVRAIISKKTGGYTDITVPSEKMRVYFSDRGWHGRIDNKRYKLNDFAFQALCSSLYLPSRALLVSPPAMVEPLINYWMEQGGTRSYKEKIKKYTVTLNDRSSIEYIKRGGKDVYNILRVLDDMFMVFGDIEFVEYSFANGVFLGSAILKQIGENKGRTIFDGVMVYKNIVKTNKTTIFYVFILGNNGEVIFKTPLKLLDSGSGGTGYSIAEAWKKGQENYKLLRGKLFQTFLQSFQILLTTQLKTYVDAQLLGSGCFSKKNLVSVDKLFAMDREKTLGNYLRRAMKIINGKNIGAKGRMRVEGIMGNLVLSRIK